MRDLQAHQSILIVTRLGLGDCFRAAGSDTVQAAIDPFQRAQGEVRKSGGQYQREQNRDAGEDHRLPQARRELVLQENRRYSDPDAAEASAVQLQRDAHVVHRRRVVHHAELAAKVGIFHQVEVGTVRNQLAHQVGIGVQDGVAVAVDDGGVVDDGPGAHDRFQKIIEIAIGAQVIRHRPASGCGIRRVHLGAA